MYKGGIFYVLIGIPALLKVSIPFVVNIIVFSQCIMVFHL